MQYRYDSDYLYDVAITL